MLSWARLALVTVPMFWATAPEPAPSAATTTATANSLSLDMDWLLDGGGRGRGRLRRWFGRFGGNRFGWRLGGLGRQQPLLFELQELVALTQPAQEFSGERVLLKRAADVGRQGLADRITQKSERDETDADPVDRRTPAELDAEHGGERDHRDAGDEQAEVERAVDLRAQARRHIHLHRPVVQAVADHHPDDAEEGQAEDQGRLQEV